MADSLEIIAKDKTDLLSEIEKLKENRDLYKRWYYEERDAHRRTIRSRDACKGHFNRLKNKSA